MADRAQLRCGTFIPPFHPLDEDPSLCIQRDLELIEHMDRLGWDEAWIGEHHSGGFEIIASPEMFIAAAAERTQRIKLGTGVISAPYHNPLTMAGRVLQLDHQTRGRAMFGFGPGLLNSDAQMLGIQASTQRERMAEAVEILCRLLDGETITKKSDWFDLKDARLQLAPYHGRRPHIACTSTVTPNGAKLAGRFDLGMLCVTAASREGYDALDANWEIACRTAREHGREMDRSVLRIMAPFHIAETREQALKDMEWGYKKWVDYAYKVSPAGPAGIGLADTPEELIARRSGVIGTPDDAVEQLERYWTKTGGFGCILVLGQNWADPETTKKSFELFARQVMPKFCGRNERRQASYDWMGENRERFSGASRAATQQALEKHAAEEAAKAGKAAE